MTSRFADSTDGRLVHIGPHKTGSTAIQVALSASRPLLAEHGIDYYAGPGVRPQPASRQLVTSTRRADRTGPLTAWEEFVASVTASAQPKYVLSDEALGKLKPAGIQRLLDDLGGDRVEIVAFARRYDKYLPSQWQERVKASRPESYEAWLRIVLGEPSDDYEYRNVWVVQDTVALVQRWLEFVPPERFTLVIANESDRSWIFSVFEDLLGLSRASLAGAADAGQSNPSLPLPVTELRRYLNRALRRAGVDKDEVQPLVAPVMNAVRDRLDEVPGPKHPPFPEWAVAPIRERSDARIEGIGALPVPVIGDPEWLRVPELEVGEQVSQTMPVEVLADALVRAVGKRD